MKSSSVSELVEQIGASPYSQYVAALCNMEVEVVAPKGAWVSPAGPVPIGAPGSRRHRPVGLRHRARSPLLGGRREIQEHAQVGGDRLPWREGVRPRPGPL